MVSNSACRRFIGYVIASGLAFLSLIFLMQSKTGERKTLLLLKEPTTVSQDLYRALLDESAFILFSCAIGCALYFKKRDTGNPVIPEAPTYETVEQDAPPEEIPSLAREHQEFLAHVRHKKLSAAEDLLRCFPQLPCSCYRLLVRTYCKNMNPELSEPWIDVMKEHNHSVDVQLTKALVHAYAKSNQPEKAEHWLDAQFLDSQADLVSFSVVLNAYGRLGNVTKIEEWLEKARDYGLPLNKIVYSTIINACSKTEDIERAEKYFIELQAANIEPDQIIWNTVIKTCARAGDLPRMNYWLKRMKNSGFIGNILTYTSIIQAWSKVGDVKRGNAALEEMCEIGVVPDQIVYNALLHGCEISGDVARAIEIVKMVVEDGLKLDRIGYRSIVRTIAKKSSNQGEVEYWSARMQRLGIRHISVNVKNHETAVPA